MGLPTNSHHKALHRLNEGKQRLREAELPGDEPLVRLLMSRSHFGEDLFRRVAAALAPQPP